MAISYQVNPGELRHAVEIQKPEYGAAGAGGASISPSSWSTVRSTRAAIYTAGGRETSNASQLVSEVSHVVKVRWTPVPIKANYRITFQGRTFTIQYVENVLERNRVQLIYCIEVNQ